MTDDELRRLAEAATPGEWRRFPTGGFAVAVDIPSEYTAIVAKSDPQWGINRDGANAAYIAAANPETMKRLLDRVAKAEADNARLRETFKVVASGAEVLQIGKIKYYRSCDPSNIAEPTP